MEGWLNITSDFNIGDVCSQFPYNSQCLVFSHDHYHSFMYIFLVTLLMFPNQVVSASRTNQTLTTALSHNNNNNIILIMPCSFKKKTQRNYTPVHRHSSRQDHESHLDGSYAFLDDMSPLGKKGHCSEMIKLNHKI